MIVLLRSQVIDGNAPLDLCGFRGEMMEDLTAWLDAIRAMVDLGELFDDIVATIASCGEMGKATE
jgi:hypothetical protein